MLELRKVRESRGKTQREVAEYLGVSRSTYARYEQDSDRLSIAQAELLCRLLKCSIDSIFPVER